MTKHDSRLDLVFRALCDPTRRKIFQRLVEAPATVGEIADPLTLSLPTVLQHLKVLEDSDLVTTRKSGRSRICRADPAALHLVRDWMDDQRAIWESRLDRLETFVTTTPRERADDN